MLDDMRYELSDDDLAWRDEVLAFVDGAVHEDLLAEMRDRRPTGIGPHETVFWRAVADRGWYAQSWPAEFGGMDLSPLRRLILTDELLYVGAPILDMTLTSLAPVIIEKGTRENHEDWLPGIRTGDIRFALGYSEPGSGTDLASLRTTAVLEDDEWVINGEKIWNTGGHRQTHEWLAVRTGVPGHTGISIIVVPIDTPGLEVQPIWTWGDHRTNQVYLSDVRVPRRNLIGEVDRGWSYITKALDNERASLGATGALRRVVDQLIAHVNQHPGLHADRDVAARLGQLVTEVEMARWLSYRVAAGMSTGNTDTVAATVSKVFTTELRTRVASIGMDLVGPTGMLTSGDPTAPLSGLLEELYRVAPMERFGGGTNEVMRDVIAQRGAGLPRAPRR